MNKREAESSFSQQQVPSISLRLLQFHQFSACSCPACFSGGTVNTQEHSRSGSGNQITCQGKSVPKATIKDEIALAVAIVLSPVR